MSSHCFAIDQALILLFRTACETLGSCRGAHVSKSFKLSSHIDLSYSQSMELPVKEVMECKF
jgi:hypothetical protein